MQSQDLGILNPSLKELWDVYRIHRTGIKCHRKRRRKYKRLVELNIRTVHKRFKNCRSSTGLSLLEVFSCSRMVLISNSGRLIDLEIDFAKKLNGYLKLSFRE